jgi:hypothetical protein
MEKKGEGGGGEGKRGDREGESRRVSEPQPMGPATEGEQMGPWILSFPPLKLS